MATLLGGPAPDPVDPGAVAGPEHAVDEPVVAGQVVLGQQADLEGGLGDAGQPRLVGRPRLLVEVAPEPVRDVVVGEPFLGDRGVAVEEPAGLGLEFVEQGSLVVVGHRRRVVAFCRRCTRGTCADLHGARPAGVALGYALPRDADRDRDALRDARCARAARCPASSRRTTTACTWSSSAAPARVRGRSSPSGWPASWRGRSGWPCRTSSRVEVDPALGDAEPDEEIHDLVRASGGLNLGMDFLPGRAGLQPGGGDRARRSSIPTSPPTSSGSTPSSTNPDRSAAEPEPARLARPAVADRPRRRAVHPPHLARPRRARAAAVRADRATTSCCRTPGRSTAADARHAAPDRRPPC